MPKNILTGRYIFSLNYYLCGEKKDSSFTFSFFILKFLLFTLHEYTKSTPCGDEFS